MPVKTIEREIFEETERNKYCLSENEYTLFKLFTESTPIEDLPQDLLNYHLRKTGLCMDPFKVDFNITYRVIADYIKEEYKIIGIDTSVKKLY